MIGPLSDNAFYEAFNEVNKSVLNGGEPFKPEIISKLENSSAENVSALNSEQNAFLQDFLQGFRTEWDNYTSYLDSQNSIQRQWLEAMAEKSFQRELDAQSTAYQREFDAMRAAGLNPYAYYLNGGSSNLTAPKYSVNSTSYATAARPQGLDNAFQLFLKQLETYSNTAYREDMTELQKQQLEMQKWQIVASFANSLSKAWSSSQNNSNYIQ